jgi:hypothetical protein
MSTCTVVLRNSANLGSSTRALLNLTLYSRCSVIRELVQQRLARDLSQQAGVRHGKQGRKGYQLGESFLGLALVN